MMKQRLQALKHRLQKLSFRTGITVLLLCIPCYIVSFAQFLLPISVGLKGVLWTIFFGMAKAFQWGGITILGVEGVKRVRKYFKKDEKNKNMLNKRIKLIILDFDGTMGDSRDLIVDTLQATLKKMNLPEKKREECAATIGLPLKECFSSMIEMSDEMSQKCADVYHEIFTSLNVKGAVKPFDGVVETIKELRRDGYRFSIASSRDRKSLEKYVADFGIADEIELILGVNDTEKHKPEPAPVLETLRKMGFSADETVVIGDTKYDILMAKRAYTTAIGVDYGNGTREELEDAGADFIISSFGDLKDVLCRK